MAANAGNPSLVAANHDLGARIHDLRHKFGYSVIERRVEGRSYSEYKLIPAVALVMSPAFAPKTVETTQNTFLVKFNLWQMSLIR